MIASIWAGDLGLAEDRLGHAGPALAIPVYLELGRVQSQLCTNMEPRR